MCGRFTLIDKPDPLALFGTADSVPLAPRYNIAPTQPVLVIRRDAGAARADFARWGLVPRWVRDPRDFPLMINARAETMADKPAFRESLAHFRCIVPASGYYEWQPGPGKAKRPFYIAPADGMPMAFAGLLAVWTGPNGEQVESVAIVTVPANPALETVHHRMPAILAGEAIDRWLDVRTVRPAEAAALARPYHGEMTVHPVSTRVNGVTYDDPGLIEPVAPQKPGPDGPRAVGSGQLDLF